MRKIVLFIAALLFMAVPVMAVPNVAITCSDDDVNEVTVSYAVTGSAHLIRAFALDINTNGANITKVVTEDPNYRIYPGQIVIVDGNVTDYNTPYAPGDLGDAKVTIEMGSLYADADPDFNHPPAQSGDLLKFYVDGCCNYKVDVNALRGGIVMEDPTENANVTLCDGNIPCEVAEYYDFGDAPNTYPTLLASNGPRHLMAGTTTGIGPILGTLIDAETDGVPTPNCDGDDLAAPIPDDEGGITNLVATPAGGSVTVTVSQATGYLNAWIDWGNDGSFAQAGDQVFTNTPVVITANNLNFVVPANAAVVMNTPLVSRWRVTSYTLAAGYYYGPATDGEVEDYRGLEVTCGTCPLDISSWDAGVPDGYVGPEDLYYLLALIGGCDYQYCDITTLPPAQKCLDVSSWDAGVPDGYVGPEDLYYLLALIGGCDYQYCACP